MTVHQLPTRNNGHDPTEDHGPADMVPRISEAEIDAVIVDTDIRLKLPQRVTTCTLTLRNGFKVSGSSKDLNREKARAVATMQARKNVSILENYVLSERIYLASLEGLARLRAEHDDTMLRGAALAAKIDAEDFKALDRAEQERMNLQLEALQRLADVLAKRIEVAARAE